MDRKKPISRRGVFSWAGLSLAGLFTSCATERVENRMDRRDNVSTRVDDNIRTRRSARDERMRRARRRNMGLY